MVIKDHPFSDGNKRIGSFLFLFYLQMNNLPLTIDNVGLTSLALLIAESNPHQKDLMIRLVVNLLVTGKRVALPDQKGTEQTHTNHHYTNNQGNHH